MTKKEAYQIVKSVWRGSIEKQLAECGIDNPDEKIIKKLWKKELGFNTFKAWESDYGDCHDWKHTDYYKYRDELSQDADCWAGPGSTEELKELYFELMKK